MVDTFQPNTNINLNEITHDEAYKLLINPHSTCEDDNIPQEEVNPQ